MLYCVDEPEVGGETLFVSGYEALANLEEGVRALAERVLVHYCLGGGGGDLVDPFILLQDVWRSAVSSPDSALKISPDTG